MKTGQLGELYALNYLYSINHTIIKTNYRTPFGEIDIISLDLQTPSSLVFTEIKTRKNLRFGSPESAISQRKIQKIFHTAQDFLGKYHKNSAQTWRFDVISLELERDNSLKTLKHYKNAFQWD